MTLREYCALMDEFRSQEELAFLRAGIIASTIANCNRDPKHTPEPFTARDFMPFGHDSRANEVNEAPDPEALLAKVRSMNRLLGGIDLTEQTD